MDEHDHLQKLIEGVEAQFKDILKNSSQGIYIYLADDHKVCNKKFSDMLGYKSPSAWAKNQDSFTDVYVADDSAKKLVDAYRNSLEKMTGSEFSMKWKTRTGKFVKTNVILVPISFQGHILALHFVTKI